MEHHREARNCNDLFVIGAAVVAFDALLNFYLGVDIFLGKVGEPFARLLQDQRLGNPNFVSDYMGMTIQ